MKERLEELAAEIVTSRPDVIVTGISGAAAAAKRATSTIPIVTAVSVDPVGLGVDQSRATRREHHRAGHLLAQLSMKRLEILKEALPGVSRVAIFTHAAAGKAAVVRHLEVSQALPRRSASTSTRSKSSMLRRSRPHFRRHERRGARQS